VERSTPVEQLPGAHGAVFLPTVFDVSPKKDSGPYLLIVAELVKLGLNAVAQILAGSA
jgi:hypothetical protein